MSHDCHLHHYMTVTLLSHNTRLSYDFHMTHMPVTCLSHDTGQSHDLKVSIVLYVYLLQVIVLYEGILPAGSTFTTQASSLHGIPSVETLGTLTYVILSRKGDSLVPRPFPPSVFHRFQYEIWWVSYWKR